MGCVAFCRRAAHPLEEQQPRRAPAASQSNRKKFKPAVMNQHTELNSALLSADARGRKHIPVAVFAVILIHIVLFVVLLVAAGCRSSVRAKANRPAPAPAEHTHPAEKYMQAATSVVPGESPVSAPEQVIAT